VGKRPTKEGATKMTRDQAGVVKSCALELEAAALALDKAKDRYSRAVQALDHHLFEAQKPAK
jgi:hypothetical protein